MNRILQRSLILLVAALPLPFIFNSCRGNLIGGTTFSSSTCNIGLAKGQVVAISDSTKASIFASAKVRLRANGLSLAESPNTPAPTLNLGTELVVLIDNTCLASGGGTSSDQVITQAATAGAATIPDAATQAYKWTLDRAYSDTEIDTQVAKETCIRGVSYNHQFKLQSTQTFNDPADTNQTYLQSDTAFLAYNGFYGSTIGMAPTGNPVIVAVIDTGADSTHPDLQTSMWNGGVYGIGVDIPTYTAGTNGNFRPADISPEGHGTHVSGMIAAGSNNGVGITGAMPYRANIMSIRLFQSDGAGGLSTTSQYFYQAIHFAIDHGAHVINLSLGEITAGANSDPVSFAAVNDAVNAGITVVVVIGNADSGNGQLIDGVNYTSIPGMYSTIPGVIGVGAYDTTTGAKSYFSHYSTLYAEIGAPGEESSTTGLYSTIPVALGSYGRLSGTSQAAPQVTAASALTIGLIRNNYGVRPTPAEVERLILASAIPTTTLAPYFLHGNRLDYNNLLATINAAYPFTKTGQHANLGCN